MRIITFLSDFGMADGYVGSVKGVIYSNFANVNLIDITHDIPPFNVEHAAYILTSYYNHFPKDTVHLTVVDPGVGSSRSALIIKTTNYNFVGPDNGIFSYIFQREAFTAFEINTAIFGESVSPTFHGRDVFAPVAAKLARGVKPDLLGYPLKKKPVDVAEHLTEKQNKIRARIISIDRFGNMVTNFSKLEYDMLLNKEIEQISLKEQSIVPLLNTYSDAGSGELLALWGSSGFLEISVNRGSAAEFLGCTAGKDSVLIKLKNKSR